MKNALINLAMLAVGAAIGSAVTWKLVKTKYERIAQEELLETTSKADAIFDGSRFNYELKCPEYIENGTIALR